MEAANSLPFSNARVRPHPRIALPRKRQSLEQGIAGGHGVVPDEEGGWSWYLLSVRVSVVLCDQHPKDSQRYPWIPSGEPAKY